MVAWAAGADFDFNGEFLKLKGVRAKPKPYGGARPVIMNAGASATGQAFAIRNCDAFFVRPPRESLDQTARQIAGVKKAARDLGRELGVYTVGVITCKPTQKEARDYYHHWSVELADWSAVDGILAIKNITPDTVPMEEFNLKRRQYTEGMGGLSIVGDPDQVAKQLADLSSAGLTGIAVSGVNYLEELPFFCDEVLPRLQRLGVREAPRVLID
jgi:FMNH2-dependent dimethyl sulfone monooxygenase